MKNLWKQQHKKNYSTLLDSIIGDLWWLCLLQILGVKVMLKINRKYYGSIAHSQFLFVVKKYSVQVI